MKRLNWQKVVTRQYTCLWAAYTADAYRIQKKVIGTELKYNLFYGQGDLLNIYRLPKDVKRSYVLIDKVCGRGSKHILSLMDKYDELIKTYYKISSKIKKEKNKAKLRELLLGLDSNFLELVCFILFFAFMGYAADKPNVKFFLKKYKNRFEKIRQYTIDMDMNRNFPILFGRYDKRLLNAAHMTRKEILQFLKSDKIDLPKINRRKKSYLFLMTPKKIIEYNPSQFGRFVDLNFSKKDVKGQGAFKGKALGIVRVIFTEKDYKKIKKNDIVVTTMTKPSIVPFLKNVKAIVTNDGGVLCHASIISREMKIPCVVGTSYATDFLKDGDRVEVDANKGIVRKI